MKVEYEDIFENNDDKSKGTENDENDTKMNTTHSSTKAKKKVEYEDTFEKLIGLAMCRKCDSETKTKGNLTDHVVKYRIQESPLEQV